MKESRGEYVQENMRVVPLDVNFACAIIWGRSNYVWRYFCHLELPCFSSRWLPFSRWGMGIVGGGGGGVLCVIHR